MLLEAGVSRETMKGLISEARQPTRPDERGPRLQNVPSSGECVELVQKALAALYDDDDLQLTFVYGSDDIETKLSTFNSSPGAITAAVYEYNPALVTLRTVFNGWCDVHDRKVITRRAAKAAKDAAQEAAKRKAEKKARGASKASRKYAEADAAPATEEANGGSKDKDADALLRHPPMSEEERERDAQRRERAQVAGGARGGGGAGGGEGNGGGRARVDGDGGGSVLQPEPTGPRKEAALVHGIRIGQERQARAAAGAQKQLDEAAARQA